MPSALITGTSSGLGRGVAQRLHTLGWDVIGTMLERPDPDAQPWEVAVADMTSDSDVEALGLLVTQRWGRLDALVNNAGIGMSGPFEELTAAELRHQLEVNLVGPMALVRACLPALRAAGGVVVALSSISGQVGDALMGPYNASKFGLEGASEALALELRPQGVRVVVVEPGPFRTPITSTSPQAAAKVADGRYAEQWRQVDDWLNWHGRESADPAECVEAIVGAVTRPDAPFRIPVGDGIAETVRRHARKVIAQTEAAEQFLRSL